LNLFAEPSRRKPKERNADPANSIIGFAAGDYVAG
jgi:hypothetical protein